MYKAIMPKPIILEFVMFRNDWFVENEDDLKNLESHWKYRLCPTYPVLKDPNHWGQVEHHIQHCPNCKKLYSDDKYASMLQSVAKRVAENMPEQPTKITLNIGQIWSLNSNLEGWDKEGNYVKAPLVLLVEQDSYYCRVVPLHSSFDFLCEQDVLISDAYENLNAEAWNSFAIHIRHLNRFYGEVQPQVMNMVFKAMKEDFEDPADPATIGFINIELRVSSFIAMNALGLLMHEYEELSRGK
jgi:hypothetical protein